MKTEERFNRILIELKEQFKRIHNKDLEETYVYKNGYVRNTSNKYSTPRRVDEIAIWVNNLKKRLSFKDQQKADKIKRYNDYFKEIQSLEFELENKKKWQLELKEELGL